MYKGKKVIQIVAHGLNGEIGLNDKLLWNIPEDMKFFRGKTMGNSLVVGRKTFESMPTLKGRLITVARSGSSFENIMDEAYYKAEMLHQDQIIIIGGGMIYDRTFAFTDVVYRTLVESEFEADTYYKPKDIIESGIGWNEGYLDSFTTQGGNPTYVEFSKFVKNT